MAIDVKCSSCGAEMEAPDELAGKRGQCPTCKAIIDIPFPMDVASGGAAAAPLAKPAAAPRASLRSMKCQGCGGDVEYKEGEGLFKCKFCGSVYESIGEDGGGTVKAIHIIEKRLSTIEGHTKRSADIASEDRLQKKAGQIQDKLDYKFIEFAHSPAKKMGGAAVIMWVVGVILFFAGMGKEAPRILLLIGPLVVGGGVGLFLLFKKKQKAYQDEVGAIKSNELEPVYAQLRSMGAVLEGGAVAVGYTESTAVPLRYCVACHKNITPAKEKGGGFEGLSGANLFLTIFTCGAWLPAWILIEAIAKAGMGASRATKSGACPQCGLKTLFPARIPNT